MSSHLDAELLTIIFPIAPIHLSLSSKLLAWNEYDCPLHSTFYKFINLSKFNITIIFDEVLSSLLTVRIEVTAMASVGLS